jgi:hypothetical protein
MDKDLKKLITLLRRRATIEGKRVKDDLTHYEGMCKGLSIAYETSANEIEKILKPPH